MDKAYSKRIGALAALASIFVALAGCGGTKILKEPQQTTQALASAANPQIAATLDWVIVRDGPGTWVRNAAWDEYLLRVQNLSNEPLEIANIPVYDSVGNRVESIANRRQLLKGSKRTARRYKKSGVKVNAGMGTGAMVAAGAAVTVVGVGVAYGAAYGAFLSGASTVGTAGTVASGLVLLGPAIMVGGIVKGVNNSRVNGEIERRQTALLITVPATEQKPLDLFFPLAPSPGHVEVTYRDAEGEHLLVIDTQAALDGLHLDTPE